MGICQLFDHFIGGGEPRLRHGHAKCLCGSKVGHRFVLVSPFNIGRSSPSEIPARRMPSSWSRVEREKSRFDPDQILDLNVRFGSKADIGLPLIDVRFTPKSGHA
jgi:hypothetical protein